MLASLPLTQLPGIFPCPKRYRRNNCTCRLPRMRHEPGFGARRSGWYRVAGRQGAIRTGGAASCRVQHKRGQTQIAFMASPPGIADVALGSPVDERSSTGLGSFLVQGSHWGTTSAHAAQDVSARQQHMPRSNPKNWQTTSSSPRLRDSCKSLPTTAPFRRGQGHHHGPGVAPVKRGCG